MIQFNATIKRFAEQGEKTGWTYIEVSSTIAEQLKPGCKKSFRVSGLLDRHKIDRVALLPMGEGHFIMALNAALRKNIQKPQGAIITVQLKLDEREIKPPADFITCLKDEPEAFTFFTTLAKSHQLYFGRWIDSAKTDNTRTKRIAQAIAALAKRTGYSEMIQESQKLSKELRHQ
jgi:hypothetical protein